MSFGDILTAYDGIGALLLGIAGTAVVTVTVDWFRRPTKLLAVSVWTENMVRQLSSWVSDLTVTYQGRAVTAASVSKVVIWNDGRKELKKDDIAPAGPVRISARAPAQILDVSPLRVSRDATRASVSPLTAAGHAEIGFDYLNPGDGLAIQVIHTGVSDADLIVAGEIIGGRSVRITDPWRRWVTNLLATVMIVGLVALILSDQLPTASGQWVYFALFLVLLAALLVMPRWPVRVLLKPHLSLKPYVKPFQ